MSRVFQSFLNELVDIHLAKEAALLPSKIPIEEGKMIAKKLKIPALLAGGYAAGKQMEQAGKDYMLGRQIRAQYESQGQ